MIDINALKEKQNEVAQSNQEAGLVQGDPTKPAFDLEGLKKLQNTNKDTSVDYYKGQQNLGFEELNKYDANLNPSSNQNLNRAINQNWPDEIKQAGSRLLPKIGFGILENAGYLAELVDFNNNDYSNSLTEFAKKNSEKFNKDFPLYKKDPNAVFNIYDSADWVEQGSGLAESIGEFFITGAGTGSLLSKGSSALSNVLRIGAKGNKLINAGNVVANSALLAYTEGAMSASSVYKDVLEKTGDKIKAGEAAASTARINTVLGTLLNLSSVQPFIKSNKWLNKMDELGLNRNGKPLAEFDSILANAKVPEENILRNLLSESVKEGIEEDVNLYSEQQGRIKGGLEKSSGDFLRDFIDSTFTKEGGLNFALGAIGGMGQTIASEHIPYNRVKNEDGTISYQSNNKLAEDEKQEKLNDYVKSIREDIKDITQYQQELNQAVANGDKIEIDKAKNNLFSVGLKNSLRKGSAQSFIQDFKDIQKVNNSRIGDDGLTDAQRLGYADNVEDNDYQVKAAKKVEDIKHLSNKYDEIQSKYNYGDEETAKLGDNVFDLYTQIYNNNQLIKDARQDLTKIKSENSHILHKDILGRVENNNSIAAINETLDYLQKEKKSLQTQLNKGKLSKRYEKLKSVITPKQVFENLTRQIDDLRKQRETLIPLSLQDLYDKHIVDYTHLGLDQDIVDNAFRKGLLEDAQITKDVVDYESKINQAESDLDIVREAYNNITSSKGRKEFVDNYYKEADKQQKDIKKEADKQAKEQKEIIEKQTIEDNKQNVVELKTKKDEIKKAKREENKSKVDTTKEDTTGTNSSPTNSGLASNNGTNIRKEDLIDLDSFEGEDIYEDLTPVEKKILQVIDKSNEEVESPDIKSSAVKKELEQNEREVESLAAKPFKIIEGEKVKAVTVAYGSNQYEETTINGVTTRTTRFENGRPILDVTSLLPNTLSVQVDDDITLVKDTEYANYKELSTSPDTLPIAIIHNGNKIGYVHTSDWVSPEANNIADRFQSDIEAETKNIRNIVFNSNKAVKGIITNKSYGRLNKIESNSNLNYGFVEQLSTFGKQSSIPNQFGKAKLVIGKNVNTAFDGNIETSEFVINKMKAGVPYILLETPIKDAYFAAYLDKEKVDDKQADVILFAINSYINRDKGKNIINGYDINTPQGLKDFINEYTVVGSKTKDKNGLGTAHTFDLYTTKDGSLIIEYGTNGKVFENKFNSLSEEEKIKMKKVLMNKFHNINKDKLTATSKYKTYKVDNNILVEDTTFDNYADYLNRRVLYTNVHTEEINNEKVSFTNAVVSFALSSEKQKAITPELSSQLTGGSDVNLIAEQKIDEQVKLLQKKYVIKHPTERIDLGFLDDINLSPDFESTDLNFYRNRNLTLDEQNQIVNTISSTLLKALAKGKNRELAYEIIKDQFINLYDKTSNEQIKSIVDNILTNWDKNDSFIGYKNLSDMKLNNISKFLDEDSESEDTILENRNFDDNATFKLNPKNTASQNVKLLLSFIPVVDKNGNRKPSIIGTETYYDYDVIYNTIMSWLSDNKFSNMMNQLEELAEAQPQFKTVVTRLKNGSTQQLNEFLGNFKKRYSEFLVASLDLKKGEYRIRSSNRNSISNLIIEKWSEAIKNSGVYSVSESGELTINKIKGKELNEVYTKLINKPSYTGEELAEIANLFNSIGIDLSLETLVDLRKNAQYQDYKTLNGLFKNKLAFVFRKLEEGNSPFGTNEESSIKILAKAQAKYETSIFSSSFKDAKGNSIFAYNNPTHLTDTFLKLQDKEYLESLEQTAFTKHSDYLRMLKDKNSKLSKTLKLSYFDATNIANSTTTGLEYNSMPSKLRNLTRLAFFQSYANDKGNDLPTNIFGLTFSDKDQTAIYSTVHYYPDSEEAKKMLYNLALSEFERIKLTTKQNSDDTFTEKIEGYHTGKFAGGLHSFLFPTLTSHPVLFNNGKINPIYLESTDANMIAALEEVVTTYIDELVQDKVSKWKEQGIYTNFEENLFDKKYLKNIRNKVNNIDDVINYAAQDYVTNYFITLGNMVQLVHGDIALAGKKNYETTIVNYFKRMAKDIAPGREQPFKEKTFKSIFINDVEFENEYSKTFGKKINGTDAQEVTTVSEHLDVLFYDGKLSDEQYNRMKSAIVPGQYYEFSKADLVVFQPMKPVHVFGDVNDNINKIGYIKSSSYPLLPQLVKDTNMDKLRISLENNGIHRAVFVSGVKLGIQHPINLYNPDGSFVENIDASKAVTLPREGFKIQQDVPLKDKKESLQGTQQRKLLFANLPVDNQYTFKDKTVGRNDLKKVYDSLHKELLTRKFNQLISDFGITKNTESGEYSFNDLTAIQNVIQEAAVDRGWSVNEIAAIQLNEDKKSFKLPLIYSSSKIESLLTSLINSRVIQNKLGGHSYIQASSIGRENNVFANSALQYMVKDNDGSYYSDIDIAWPYKDLNYIDYINEDGTPKENIDQSLCYIIGYRIPTQGHNSMMRMKVRKFLHPNVGDLAFVPSELTLQMGSDFDVDKLYTYNYLTELVDGKLTKVDSSFDELITSKSDEQIKNDIVEINHSILGDGKTQDLIKTPLGFDNLQAEVERIDNILNKNKKTHSILYDETSDDAYNSNRSGKLLTGLTSLSATNHALAQEAHLYIRAIVEIGKIIANPLSKINPIVILFKDENGKVYREFEDIKLTKKDILKGYALNFPDISNEGAARLDKVIGFTNKSIASVISELQSAAVDNAKEQIVDRGNLNKFTYGVAGLLARVGFDETFIIPFLKQESILAYVEGMENLNDPTIAYSNRSKKDSMIKELLLSYEKNADYTVKDIQPVSREEMNNMILFKANNTGNGLVGKQNLTLNKAYNALQAQILYNFLQYNKVAEELQTIQSAINPETKGIGKSISDSKYKEQQINSVKLGNGYIGNVNNLFNSFVGELAELSVIESNKIFKNIYPYFEPSYKFIENAIGEELGKQGILQVEDYDLIHRELKAALYSSTGFIGVNDIDDERNRLLIDEFQVNEDSKIFTKNSLAQRLSEYKGTNNFLNRLSTQLTLESGKPSFVLYFSGVKEDGENLTNAIAWQDAISNGTEEEQLLGKDLLNYAYLTGGQNRTSFVQFIPVQYQIDRLSNLPQFKDNDLFAPIYEQFFQHYPTKTRQIKSDLSQLVQDSIPTEQLVNGKVKEDYIPTEFKLPKSTDSAVIDLLVGKNNEQVLPDYVHLRKIGIHNKSEIFLYTKVNTDVNQNTKYIQIPTLGSYNHKEYNINKGIRVENQVGIEVISQEPNKVKLSSILEAANSNDINKVFNQIIDNERYGALAKELKDKINNISISLNYDLAAIGRQFGNTIEINPNKLKSENSVINTILHETIHSLTSTKIKQFYNDKSKLTADEIKHLTSLDRAYKLVLSKIENGESKAKELEQYLRKQAKNENLSPDERITANSLHKDIKGLSNLDEFVAVALTNSEVQSFLNDIPFDHNRSLLERIFDLIASIVGVDLKSGSVLESTVFDVLGIINEDTENTNTNLLPDFQITNDENLDLFISKWRNRISYLQGLKTADKVLNADLDKRIANIQRNIDTLLDAQDVSTLLDIAKTQLAQLGDILKEPVTIENQKKASSYLFGWEMLDTIFDYSPDSDAGKIIASIMSNVNYLTKQYNDNNKVLLKELAKNKGINLTNKSFEPQIDANFFGANFFDSSISKIEIEQYLSKLVRDTYFEINEESNIKIKDIQARVDSLLKSNKDAFSSLLQKDNDDNLTGNLVSEFSQEYYDKVKELKKDAINNPKDWKKYWDWVKDNSYFASIDEVKNGVSKNFNKDELTKGKELLDLYDKTFADFKVEEAERLSYQEQYKDKDSVESIENDYLLNLSDNIIAWELANSPYLREQYEKDVGNGTRKSYELANMKGYKYLLYPKPKEQWQDEAYTKIKENSQLFEFYTFFKDTVKEYLNYLPNVEGVQSNTIPELAKTLRQEIVDNGLVSGLNKIGGDTIKSLTIEGLENTEYGIIDPVTGEPLRVFRANMLNNNLSPELKNYDLGEVLKSYVSMGTAIKYKSLIEDEVLLAENMINELDEVKVNAQGPINDWQGNRIVISGGLPNVKSRVKYLVDTFYGKRKELEGVGKIIKDGKLQGKNLVGSKIADEVIQFTQAKGIGLNPFSGITNLFFGTVSNVLHSANAQEFNEKEYFQGFGIMMKALNPKAKDNRTKIAALMSKLQVLGDSNELNYGSKSIYDKLFFFQRMGEYASQGNVMISMLLHQNLWDKFNVVDGELVSDLSKDDLLKLSGQIQQTIKYLHGNYNINSPILIKKKVWGRLLMMFRNWIPYTLQNRFGAEQYDAALGRVKKGRYISVKDIYEELGLMETIKTFAKLSLFGKLADVKVDNISATDLANMKENMREVSIGVSLYLMSLLLQGLTMEDDDEKSVAVYKYFLNVAGRIESDLWFFLNPADFQKIIQDPIPAMKTLNDFGKLAISTGNFVIGDDKIPTGRNAGDSRVLRDLQSAFPLINQPKKIVDLASQVAY